ncbi:2Fe-2S iron-sulfur cluster-binding protein [Dongia rigui]|uniref:2Fe-2S iron-sulfur cluster-binding protein n=1 Tax=Dongia rigui TaxID=940149 RepID=A0ABU5E2T7_9PROT|nr:2Fe-2S iron-sulfur cluster-binding protein [Dongia rigui]MDY0873895.1 2Fe-2S iron-sulfur cluster-binding protein [Dongia rigui]
MSNVNRLPAPFGRLLDRSETVTFDFEGRTIEGFKGDTIASALCANDQWMISRSFKYHRPRGVLTMAGQDANTLVQLSDEPNCLADKYPAKNGLKVKAQNYFGSFDNDMARVVELVHRFLPVGFYYKTFHEKKQSWSFWEPVVRAMTGLGAIDPKADFHESYYDKQYLFADVAVIGGGPAGLAAAQAAAESGADVILIEENAALGGSLGYARFDAEGISATRQLGDFERVLGGAKGVTVMTGTICSGLFSDNWIPLIRGNRFYKLRAKSIVVATGSIEQPAVFRNNDLPGVMMASAAQRLIKLYGVRPGRTAVILAANDDAYGAALDLIDAGVTVAAIADLRQSVPATPLVAAVRARGVEILAGHAISEALYASKTHISGAALAPVTGEGRLGTGGKSVACDLILMSVGFSPAGQLLHHAGAKFGYCRQSDMFQPVDLPAKVHAAGSVNNVYDLGSVIADGKRAGLAAARDAGLTVAAVPAPIAERGNVGRTHPWPIFPHDRGFDFVDFDEDLKYHDLINGIADGYDNVELLKRYSTVGMGPSQGRHSAVTSVRIVSRETGVDIAGMSVTTQRPPYTPEKFGHLAGRVFDPERRTAMHHRHLELGAQMMPAGVWWRPAYYGGKADRAQAIETEVKAVRQNVGLIDVSTLGGLDVRGPDAAEFLNRMYTFSYTKQPIGRSRYVLMTDNAGVITDDGVACRFHDEHFYVTATTSGVDSVYRQMLFWNAQWRLDVDVANVTAALCGVNIAGPKSRAVLQKVCTDIDLSPEGFPYMGVKMGTVAGIPARLMRVGFVGELGYEIHVPAGYGEALWDALMEAGKPEGIRPFGVEAQRVLRLEKGHIIVSQDTDGLTNVWEADMPWALAKTKPFFVGGKSTEIMGKMKLARKLVGFTLKNDSDPCPEECHLVLKGEEIVGRVTSAVKSPSVGKVVGLAYVHGDDGAPGTEFTIKVEGGRRITGVVTKYPFYDPENKRQEM